MRVEKPINKLYMASVVLAVGLFYCPFSGLLFIPIWVLMLLISMASTLRRRQSVWEAHVIGALVLLFLLEVLACPFILPMSGIDKRVAPLVVHESSITEFISSLQKASGYPCFVVVHEQPDIGWERPLMRLPNNITVSTSSKRLGDLLNEINTSLGLVAMPQGGGGVAESLSGHYSSMRGITVHILDSSTNSINAYTAQ